MDTLFVFFEMAGLVFLFLTVFVLVALGEDFLATVTVFLETIFFAGFAGVDFRDFLIVVADFLAAFFLFAIVIFLRR
ncbi:MAG TPA: hypothetical protein PLP23_08790 [Panacibacter sp.]|nr:hypothetical protein [Panacibacter sp.]